MDLPAPNQPDPDDSGSEDEKAAEVEQLREARARLMEVPIPRPTTVPVERFAPEHPRGIEARWCCCIDKQKCCAYHPQLVNMETALARRIGDKDIDDRLDRPMTLDDREAILKSLPLPKEDQECLFGLNKKVVEARAQIQALKRRKGIESIVDMVAPKKDELADLPTPSPRTSVVPSDSSSARAQEIKKRIAELKANMPFLVVLVDRAVGSFWLYCKFFKTIKTCQNNFPPIHRPGKMTPFRKPTRPTLLPTRTFLLPRQPWTAMRPNSME